MIDTKKRDNKLEIAYASLELEGKPITVKDLAEEMEIGERSVQKYIKEHDGFELVKGESKGCYVQRKSI